MPTPALTFKTYLAVFIALLVLTALTTGVAYIDLGRLNSVVSLTIAGAKALIVTLFFMDLLHSPHRTQIVAGAGILWLLILISLTLSDGLTRGWFPAPNGWH
jgi:cytochrome c oxidase subunit 4